MSMQAVCIKSLISFPLVTAFLKHSCNLLSGKGDPPLNKRKEFLNLKTHSLSSRWMHQE